MASTVVPQCHTQGDLGISLHVPASCCSCGMVPPPARVTAQKAHLTCHTSTARCQTFRNHQDAVDPSRSGRGIYFSHAYDLTLTAQRIADADAAPASGGAPVGSPARADRRFWYNYSLAKPLADAGAYRCERVGDRLPGLSSHKGLPRRWPGGHGARLWRRAGT